MLESLVVDGVIAGVGSVIVFLPQILILFLFIILMEDTGYLARAAFLVDRAMRSVGLSGQSVIPLLSSFACAVPSIMATRVIPNRRDRIATILAAPFMTCSARLPVYALLIGAFVPVADVGIFNLQGLVLFGAVRRSASSAASRRRCCCAAPCCAARTRRSSWRCPSFALPNVRNVATKLLDRVRVFLRSRRHGDFRGRGRRLGAHVFPALAGRRGGAGRGRGASHGDVDGRGARGAARAKSTIKRPRIISSRAGSAGRGMRSSPLFRPLGWDWRVSAAVIAGFPAREVVVAVLGTIYAVGGEADEQTLAGQLTVGAARGRQPGVHVADGARLAAVLRLVLAVRRDARRHSPRDQ